MSMATSRPMIEIKNVSRLFGPVKALDDVSLAVNEGEFFSLLGPSGCGKTTLLRIIAGFQDPSTGEVSIGGEDMVGVPANHRPTNMVFQSYAIFPHLTVRGNVGFGLRRLKLAREELDRRVDEALDMVDLEGLGDRGAHQLSGGQRQRVALARALVLRPKVLLLDEPLSALDKKLREQMQVELRQLQRAVGITFVLVTHDQFEALTMSDRIAVMFGGRIAQVASPKELYEQPANRQVAAFIGGMNFVKAAPKGSGNGKLRFETDALGTLDVPAKTGFDAKGGEVVLGVRPERLGIHVAKPNGQPAVEGTVADTSYFGEMTYYYLSVPGREEPIIVSASNSVDRPALARGQRAWLTWDTGSMVPLT